MDGVGNDCGRARRLRPWPQVLIVVGVVLSLVPVAMSLWMRGQTGEVVTVLESDAQTLTEGEREEILAQATSWNAYLSGQDGEATVPEDELWDYEDQLSYGDAEAMAWIEIPAAAIELPIYHGDGEESLASGVGHLSASSLPVGGTGTCCWIEGHSGLSTTLMFDNIRVLEEGDVIGIHVLDDMLAYRVTGWEIVGPDEVTTLDVRGSAGADTLVLVTCTTTPDAWNEKGRTGINDKRLLVYAERCEYEESEFAEAVAEAATDPEVVVNDYTWQALCVAALGAVALVVRLVAQIRRRRRGLRPGGSP